MARRASAAVALAVCAGASAGRAFAHDELVSASEVDVAGATLVWKVDVGLQGLGKVVKLPVPEVDLGEDQLRALKPDIARVLAGGLVVSLNGRVVTPVVGALLPRYEPFVASGVPYIARVSLELRYLAPEPVESLAADVRFFADLTSQHRAVVDVHWDGQRRQIVRLGPARIELERGQVNPTVMGLALEFARWGAHHIFIGYDHIAFLLALLLAVGRFGELLKIITSFTAAHSLTLGLAAFEIIRLPSRVTESLIAASIVYVAAENLLRTGGDSARHRWLLTFAFGLVHGLGFASVLQERLVELQGRLVLPVLFFNLGVEAGQVVIVACAFPLLLWLRRARVAPGDEAGLRQRHLRIVRAGSLPILILGIGWLAQRLLT